MTEQELARRHGDVLVEGRMREAAIAAFHNPARALLLAAEMAVLTGEDIAAAPLLLAGAHGAATAQLAELKLDDALDHARFLAAARSARDDAEKLLAEEAPDEKALADALWRRLINHLLIAESAGLARELDEVKRRAAAALQDGPAALDEEAATVLEELVTRHALLTEGSEGRGRPAVLNAWAAQLEAQGRSNRALFSDIVRQDREERAYTDLPVAHVRELIRAIGNVIHLGAQPQMLVDAEESRDLEEAVDELLAALAAQPGSGASRDHRDPYSPAAAILAEIDGAENGPAQRHILAPIERGLAARDRMLGEAAEKLNRLYALYSPEEQQSMSIAVLVPETGRSMTKWQMIAYALALGHSESLSRLSNPSGGGPAQPEIQAIAARLEPRDWAFVQGIWHLFDGFWPTIETREQRVTGHAPAPVEPQPMVTPYGVVSGGFFPLVPARPVSAVTERRDPSFVSAIERGAFARAHTRDGMAQAAAAMAQTPLFDLAALHHHLMGLIQDLALSEPLVNARRILRHQDVMASFAETGRTDDLKALHRWLDQLRGSELRANELVIALAPVLTSGGTAARMIAGLGTALVKASGLAEARVQQDAALARGLHLLLSRGVGGIADIAAEAEAAGAAMAERRKPLTDSEERARLLIDRARYILRDLPLWLAGAGTAAQKNVLPDEKPREDVMALLVALASFVRARYESLQEDDALAWAADMGLFAALAQVCNATASLPLPLPAMRDDTPALPAALRALAGSVHGTRGTATLTGFPLIGLPPDLMESITASVLSEAAPGTPPPLATIMDAATLAS
ncbi:hypothetical protein GCM10007276_34290 [Agaricicola taiwanensis]|uniref:Uncharacterized protein n=1 Tax=Agaricicola taiwanensis TaxID=591372 RepID=A0A8J2YN24_9RHOB|nr:hypothetical protein [Agaricicola taiwanensis]GGE54349.1 hypothetical protein GCM10007276_34290 [Agaricicola taiwanensis]